jgi:hypothetical protein
MTLKSIIVNHFYNRRRTQKMNTERIRIMKKEGLIIVFLFLAFATISSIAMSDELPYFAPLDAGGIPSNLREIRPNGVLECDIISAGDYYIWVAIRENNKDWTQWEWKRSGPYKLLGGQRYNAHIGDIGLIVDKFRDLRYYDLKKTETCVRFQNFYTDKWLATTIPERVGDSDIGTEPPHEKSGSISGRYNLVANNYKGYLEISSDMTGGRIFFDIGNSWEEISNLTYNSSTGEIYFTRPWAGNPTFQQYTGRVSGNKIKGVFTDTNYGSQEFPWEAVK